MGQTLATPTQAAPEHEVAAPQAEHEVGDNAFAAEQLAGEQAPADPEDPCALESLVRAVSPLLADVLDRGVTGVYGQELSEIIEARVAERLDQVELGATVEGLVADLGGAVATVVGVAAGDQRCCSALEGWIAAMTGSFGEAMLGGRLDDVTEGLEQWRTGPGSLVIQMAAEGFVVVADAVAPQVTGALGTVSKAIDAVAAVDRGAADWVAGKIGLGEAEAGMAALLTDLWDELVGAVQGAFDAAIDGVLEAIFALPGTEEVYRLVDAGTDLIAAAQFLAGAWNDPDALLQAPEALADNLFQGFVVGSLEAMQAARSLADGWMVAGPMLLEQLSAAIDTALGVPVLGAFAGVLQGVREAVAWVVESPLWGELASAMQVLASFGTDVVVALGEVLVALPLAGNPVGLAAIVASEALQLLPDCYKAPVLDALATIAATLADALLASVLLGAGGSLGPALVEAVHPAVAAVLGEVTGRSNEEKAQILEQIARMLSPETAAELVLGLGTGLVTGAFAEIKGTLEMLYMIGTGANDLLIWLLTRGPAAVGTAVGGLADFAGTIVGAIDAAGDRHFESPEPQAAPEEQAARQRLADALQGVVTHVNGLVAVPGLGMRSVEEVEEVFTGLFAWLVDAMAQGAATAAGAAIDTFLAMGGAAFGIGSAIGNVVSTLFLEVILGKGAGLLARSLPMLADLLRGLRLLLAAPDAAIAGIAAPLRGLLAQVGPFLRSLGNPMLDNVLDALDDVGRALDELLEPLNRKARDTPDEKKKHDAELGEAMKRATPEVRGLMNAVDRFGDADLRNVAEEVLIRLDKEQSGELAELLLEDVVDAAREELDLLVVELACDGAKAVLPDWYDPDATAWQNVSRYLVARVTDQLAEEPEQEAA